MINQTYLFVDFLLAIGLIIFFMVIKNISHLVICKAIDLEDASNVI
jgi:hypothetical protein